MSLHNWVAMSHSATLSHLVMSGTMERGLVRDGDMWHVMNFVFALIAAGTYAHWKVSSP